VADLHRARIGDVDPADPRRPGASLSRVPPHSGQAVNVTARSTNARTYGCSASTSLDKNDFWIFGIRPLVRQVEAVDLDLGRPLVEQIVELGLVYLRMGLSGSRELEPLKMRPYQPSTL
jgi:hypothetical protein